MTARRRYVLTGVVCSAVQGYRPDFLVTITRGKGKLGEIRVRDLGTPHASATDSGLGELPEDHRAALLILARNGFTGSWVPTGRAPSTDPSRAYRLPFAY